MPIISLSLTEPDIALVNKLAKEQDRSRSQIMKEALALYSFEKTWQDLRTTGERIAKHLGIESDDDVQTFAG
jgi:hypothetical protein